MLTRSRGWQERSTGCWQPATSPLKIVMWLIWEQWHPQKIFMGWHQISPWSVLVHWYIFNSVQYMTYICISLSKQKYYTLYFIHTLCVGGQLPRGGQREGQQFSRGYHGHGFTRILGPVPFILNMLPLDHISRRHAINFHRYTDDAQPYLTLKPDKIYRLT